MTKDELKRRVCEAIDRHRDEIFRIGETILQHPETGFKEARTARLAAETMERLGLRPQTGLALTGVKGRLAGKAPGPTLAILGELDGLTVSGHPHADPATGAAHACGHNAQVAAMLGAAMGIAEAGAMAELAGALVFFAVPAEEFIEIEERLDLVRQKKLGFMLGKQELIRLGHFDDVDLAMMFHAASSAEFPTVGRMVDSSNGAVVKRIRFLGKAAHAGGRPHMGINALSAALLALNAIHAQRETFREADTVRIHPIVTKGGDAVSVVPAEVKIETFVRGATLEAILDANRKVERCLRAGAMAMGAEVEIETIPAYLPQHNNRAMGEVYGANLASLFGAGQFPIGGHKTGSTDMGDLGHLMPVIHPYLSGGEGSTHADDWKIVDRERIFITSAKLLAMTAIDLLHGDAAQARQVLAQHKPALSKAAYLEMQAKVFSTERYRAEG
jgi:amidohydrolase